MPAAIGFRGTHFFNDAFLNSQQKQQLRREIRRAQSECGAWTDVYERGPVIAVWATTPIFDQRLIKFAESVRNANLVGSANQSPVCRDRELYRFYDFVPENQLYTKQAESRAAALADVVARSADTAENNLEATALNFRLQDWLGYATAWAVQAASSQARWAAFQKGPVS
jgi:hypothetical protein